jgi:ring-1,2-phenylacetyl-CoA epoxidase subunit PaaC
MPGAKCLLNMTVPDHLKSPLIDLLLALADDKLFLGHRNSDWTGLGPILEEDIAFSHMAQDEIAHAQAIYEFIGGMTEQKADDIAFGRSVHEYRCASIVEVPDEFDWATAVARKFYCDHFDLLRLQRLASSDHKPLADLCGRIAAEEQLHVDHVDGWIVRLGQGTMESRSRLQTAIDALAPHATWLFEPFDGLKALVDTKVYPGSDFTMYDAWTAAIKDVCRRAGLTVTLEVGSPDEKHGRRGVATSHRQPLLDEMCEVYRLEPGAAW